MTEKPKKRVDRNKRPQFQKGDKYTVTNTADVLDVDENGTIDIIVKHETQRNGQWWFRSSAEWSGCGQAFGDEIKEHLKPLLGEDQPMRNIGQLVKHWKTLDAGNGKILQMGLKMAQELGELD